MTVFNKKPVIFIVKDIAGNSVLLPMPEMLNFASSKKLCDCIRNRVDVTKWIYGHMQDQSFIKLEEDNIKYTIRRVQ